MTIVICKWKWSKVAKNVMIKKGWLPKDEGECQFVIDSPYDTRKILNLGVLDLAPMDVEEAFLLASQEALR